MEPYSSGGVGDLNFARIWLICLCIGLGCTDMDVGCGLCGTLMCQILKKYI